MAVAYRSLVPDVKESLSYVYDAIKMTKEKLNDEIPLIGFAGSPWTILCYCVQGQGSKNFDKAKEFCFTNPIAAHQLLHQIWHCIAPEITPRHICKAANRTDCVREPFEYHYRELLLSFD